MQAAVGSPGAHDLAVAFESVAREDRP